MAGTADSFAPRRWHIGFVLVAILIVALFVGAWVLYTAVTTSLQAERNLHATLFTIRLVEQFVHNTGRWPESWDELEQMQFPSDAPSPMNGELNVLRIGGSRGYNWPAESLHIRECVHIDFDADTDAIIHQDALEFAAIKPMGPYYEYRDYGFVDSLQETLSKASRDGHPTLHEAAEFGVCAELP